MCYTATACCVKFQALDTFDTAVVSPIYYAMFTTLTILASAIMFKVKYFFYNFSEHIILVLPCYFDSKPISDDYTGLVWAKSKQHSLRDLWVSYSSSWDCCATFN